MNIFYEDKSMIKLNRFPKKKVVWFLISCSVTFLFFFLIDIYFFNYVHDYNAILTADTIEIYNEKELIVSLDEKEKLIENDFHILAIKSWDLQIWNVSSEVIYRLVFIKDDKIISKMEVIRLLEKEGDKSNWFKMGQEYVIIRSKKHYLGLNNNFFNNLDKIILDEKNF